MPQSSKQNVFVHASDLAQLPQTLEQFQMEQIQEIVRIIRETFTGSVPYASFVFPAVDGLHAQDLPRPPTPPRPRPELVNLQFSNVDHERALLAKHDAAVRVWEKENSEYLALYQKYIRNCTALIHPTPRRGYQNPRIDHSSDSSSDNEDPYPTNPNLTPCASPPSSPPP